MSDDWDTDGNPWTVTGVKRSYETGWFAVDDHDVITPVGKPGKYGVIKIPRLAVGVVPLDENGDVHLVGQWRFPLGRYSWELPEGGAEAGETAEFAARRELSEETGLKAARLERILEMDMSNSLTDEQAVLFLATGLSQGEARPDDSEVLRRRSAPFREVLDRVSDGRIRDSLTVAAILRVHHMGVTGILPDALSQAILRR